MYGCVTREVVGDRCSYTSLSFLTFRTCAGGTAQLVLDATGALVGLGFLSGYCGFRKQPSTHFRVPPVADWIERNVCALSDSLGELPFCPALVCPRDARLLGYPWALLPNGTSSIQGAQGFEPVRAIQSPPPGTPLWRDTTTNVTITAFDALGIQLECIWKVDVPPLVEVGVVEIPVTDDGPAVHLFGSDLGGNGRIFKMTGRLVDRLRGSGGSVNSRLRKGGDKYTGSIRLANNRTRGAVAFPTLDVKFSNFAVPGVQLELEAKRVTKAVTVVYKLYGQEEAKGVACPSEAGCTTS
jgi:hypothetical protein